MSILTSFLNLFKYDPVADKENTFNITTALNENWDKLDNKIEEISNTIEGIEAPVTSVNSKTGSVILNANDVGAATPSSVTIEVETHIMNPLPHEITDPITLKRYKANLGVRDGAWGIIYQKVEVEE